MMKSRSSYGKHRITDADYKAEDTLVQLVLKSDGYPAKITYIMCYATGKLYVKKCELYMYTFENVNRKNSFRIFNIRQCFQRRIVDLKVVLVYST